MRVTEDDLQRVRRVEYLMAHYIGCIDQDDLERWPQFFTEDGVYRITSRENVAQNLPAGYWYCRGQGMMRDRIQSLRQANIYEPHVYCHHISGTRCLGQEGSGWRFHTNFQVVRTMQSGEMSVFAVGCFNDLIVEEDGILRFQEKIVICDASRIDTLLVIPI